jgi:tetratricopeptide (TPR) repeat protein
MNVHFLQAIAHNMLGDSEKAIESLESIVNQDIGFPYAPTLLTQLRKSPATHYRGRMLTWLLTLSGPILIAIPNESPVDPMHLSLALPHQEKGITYALKQQYTAGLEALELAHQLAPENPNAQLNRAYIYAIEGHIDAANHVLQSPQFQQMSKTGRLHLEAGLLDMAGNSTSALSLLESNTRPTALCKVNMGFLHWKLQHYDTAIALWEDSLQEMPAFPFVARCLAPIHKVLPDLNWLPPVFQFPKAW